MQTINTSLPQVTTFDRLALYSGLDVLSLYEIKDGIMALMDSNRLSTYQFEMELQAPLLNLSFAGIPVDEFSQREMITVLTQEQSALTTLINRLLEAIGYFSYYRNMAVAEFTSACTSHAALFGGLGEFLSGQRFIPTWINESTN